ncbi:hypothetical protein L7F22_062356 [Adiantum nelumboides]|nr:hypothetical protein [Adiantum nelumboides]
MAASAPVLGTTEDAPRPVTWRYELTEEDEAEMQTAIKHFSGRTLVGCLVGTTPSRPTVRERIESALGGSIGCILELTMMGSGIFLLQLSDFVSTDALLARSQIPSGSRLLVFQPWTPLFDRDEFDRPAADTSLLGDLILSGTPHLHETMHPSYSGQVGYCDSRFFLGTPRIQVYAPGDTQFLDLLHIRDRAGQIRAQRMHVTGRPDQCVSTLSCFWTSCSRFPQTATAYGHTPLMRANFVLQHKVAFADQLVQEMQDVLVQVNKGGFLEVGVQTYGSGLWHTWFDRDLTIAGRVILKQGSGENMSFSHELVKIGSPILRIPTLAIHLDRNVQEGFKFNTQTHLAPVLATTIKDELNKQTCIENNSFSAEENCNDSTRTKKVEESLKEMHHSLLLQLLAQELECQPEEICDFELQLCDTQPSLIGGALKEFIFSGRLDNLCMSFCSLKALIDASNDNSLEQERGVRMVALFDHEEVGSNSAQGAGSPAMFDALSRVTLSFASSSSKVMVDKAIQCSFLVSADMAHCLHPNYLEKHEENHQPKMHKGLVIKHNANQRYATNAVTSFIFRHIATKHEIPVQDFVVRNDMGCGSTIGPILASGVGIRTVDVGAPQLSMHSIREMCGVDDVGHSYQHLKAFFKEFSQIDTQLSVDC